MPAPYTESFSGTVARVWPAPDAGHSHQIILRDALRSTHRFYCWDGLKATFCQQRAADHKAIVVEFSRTGYGNLIIHVDYAPPDLEPAV